MRLTSFTGRWIPLLVCLVGLTLTADVVQAQERGRGRTSNTENSSARRSKGATKAKANKPKADTRLREKATTRTQGRAQTRTDRRSDTRHRVDTQTTARRDRTRVDTRRQTVTHGKRSTYRHPYPSHQRPKYKYRKHYHTPKVRINVHMHWPWMVRYERRWAPRYRYRQVVYVEAGWGRNHRRSMRVDVQTYYRHEVRHATNNYAEVDIYIEQIELYQGNRYLGNIHHIPNQLSKIRATIYRNGEVHFDRDVFLVGDPYDGFELISTRYYGGQVLDAYHHDHGYRAGRVDLHQGRIVPINHSRFFDPYKVYGYVPISLLPDDHSLIGDYGDDAFSAYYDDYDYYYGGTSSGYPQRDVYTGRVTAPRGQTNGLAATGAAPAFQRDDEQHFRTKNGVDVKMKRSAEFERID